MTGAFSSAVRRRRSARSPGGPRRAGSYAGCWREDGWDASAGLRGRASGRALVDAAPGAKPQAGDLSLPVLRAESARRDRSRPDRAGGGCEPPPPRAPRMRAGRAGRRTAADARGVAAGERRSPGGLGLAAALAPREGLEARERRLAGVWISRLRLPRRRY